MIGYMDRTAGAVEHCESMATQNTNQQGPAAVSEAYQRLADYLRQKLWHQLTMLVLELLERQTAVISPLSFLSLYDKVVLCVDSKLNPLSLAKIASLVAQGIAGQDETAAKAILENLLTKKDALGVPATIYVQSKLMTLTLATLSTSETTPETESTLLDTKTKLKSNKDLLHELPAEGNNELASVHAAHYQAAMQYYKRIGPPEAFYEQALSFLQYAPPPPSQSDPASSSTPTTSAVNYRELAVDLILAALTGDGVYNLGQVEQTPLLKLLLQSAETTWLVHLLQAVASGNVPLFRQYQQEYAAQISQQPALVNRAIAVQEKLTLLALVHLVFSKPSHERKLTFEEISAALHLESIDQVEWVVMRALSVHLIEGSLDQVSQTVNVTWVLPRVLQPAQMQELATRFGEWAAQVSQIQQSMSQQAVALG